MTKATKSTATRPSRGAVSQTTASRPGAVNAPADVKPVATVVAEAASVSDSVSDDAASKGDAPLAGAADQAAERTADPAGADESKAPTQADRQAYVASWEMRCNGELVSEGGAVPELPQAQLDSLLHAGAIRAA